MPLEECVIPPQLFAPALTASRKCIQKTVNDCVDGITPPIQLYLYYGNHLPADWACALQSSHGTSLPTRSLDLKRQYVVEYFFGNQLARIDYFNASFQRSGLVPCRHLFDPRHFNLHKHRPSMAFVGIRGQRGSILENMAHPEPDRRVDVVDESKSRLDHHRPASSSHNDSHDHNYTHSHNRNRNLNHNHNPSSTPVRNEKDSPESPFSIAFGCDYGLRLGTGGERTSSLSLDPVRRYSLSTKSSRHKETPRNQNGILVPIPEHPSATLSPHFNSRIDELFHTDWTIEDDSLFKDAQDSSHVGFSRRGSHNGDHELRWREFSIAPSPDEAPLNAGVDRAVVHGVADRRYYHVPSTALLIDRCLPRFPSIQSARDVYREMLWAVEHWDTVLLIRLLIPSTESSNIATLFSPNAYSRSHDARIQTRFQASLRKMNHLADYTAYETAWTKDQTTALSLQTFIRKQLAQVPDLDQVTVKRFHETLWTGLWTEWNAFVSARRELFAVQMRILHMVVNQSTRQTFRRSFGGGRWTSHRLGGVSLGSGPFQNPNHNLGIPRCSRSCSPIETCCDGTTRMGKSDSLPSTQPDAPSPTPKNSTNGSATHETTKRNITNSHSPISPSHPVPTPTQSQFDPLLPDYNNYLSIFVNYSDCRDPDELSVRQARFRDERMMAAYRSGAQKWIVHQLRLQVYLQMQHQFGGKSGRKMGECRAGWSASRWRRAVQRARYWNEPSLGLVHPVPNPTQDHNDEMTVMVRGQDSERPLPITRMSASVTLPQPLYNASLAGTGTALPPTSTLKISKISPIAPHKPMPPDTPFTPGAIQVPKLTIITSASRVQPTPLKSSVKKTAKTEKADVEPDPVHYSPCGSCIGEERELYHHRPAGVWYSYRGNHWRKPRLTV